MSTLLDRLRRGGQFDELRHEPMPVIVGTEVSRLIFGGAVEMPSENWEARSIPVLTPPFRNFFVESKVPDVLGEYGEVSERRPWPHPGITGFGLYFFSVRDWGLDMLLSHSMGGTRDYVASLGGRERVVWLMEARLYIENWGREHYCFTRRLIGLDEHGVPLGNELQQRFSDRAIYRILPSLPDGMSGEANILYQALYALGFMTVCLLNCRGKVSLEEHQPVPALQKKHLKRHGVPLSRYHVLKVGGMEALLRREGRLVQVGPMQALHLCRGHVKRYGEAHKLFGKTTGSFYWEPQLRGSNSRGVVVKDYEVQPEGAEL